MSAYEQPEFTGTERFRVERSLGAGGMGVVYLVHDAERGIDVALKVLSGSTASADLGRIKQEFRALADVTHPNLVALHELVADGTRCFFTMEHVDGIELTDWLIGADLSTSSPSLPGFRTSQLSPPEPPSYTTPTTRDRARDRARSAERTSSSAIAARDSSPRSPTERPPHRADLARMRSAVRQLADALVTLHDARRLHLDLKPSNVLVRRDGRVVVLDFGIARNLDRDDEDEPDGGDDSEISGTPTFMAPEQAMGSAIGTPADWYAVGTMLHLALTGHLPFEGSTASVLLGKQMRDGPRPSARVSEVPSDLDDLVASLLVRDPEARATAADVLAWCGGGGDLVAPAARAKTVFVGRDASIADLETALETTRAEGRPILAWVGGRSGMGKTALVSAFLARARQRADAIVLASRCYERESVPFKAFDGIADAIVRYLRGLPTPEAAALLPRDAHALAKVFPVLSKVRALEGVPNRARAIVDPQELRVRAFRALKELLAAVARDRAVVAFVDDLQWSDADSATLLEEMLTGSDAPAMLFVGSFRSDERDTNPVLRELLDALARSPIETRTIDVGPLSPDETRRLARSLALDGGAIEDAKIDALASESDGSPLFVSELVRHAAIAPAGADTPASLDGLIAARVHGLDASARTLLELVALAGVPIEQAVVLRAGAGGDTKDLSGALALLRGASLVRTRGGRPADPVECFHDRVRQTVASALDHARKTSLSGVLADALERTGRADPELLAHHCKQAGFVDRAARHAEIAADLAARSLAFDRAARLYGEALEGRARDGAAATSLLRRMAVALGNAGRGREAGDAYLAAAQNVDREDALDLQRLAAEQYLLSGRMTEGSQLLDGLLAAVDLPHVMTPRAAVVWLVWQRARNALRGLDWQERAESEIPRDELRRVDVCIAATLGFTVVEPVCGAAYQAILLSHALDVGEPRRVAMAMAGEAGHVASTGTANEARSRELFARAEAICTRIAHPEATAFYSVSSGLAALCLGRWTDAITHADRAEKVLREECSGVNHHLDQTQGMRVTAAAFLGDLGLAARTLDRWMHESEERGDLYGQVVSRVAGSAHALLHLTRDDDQVGGDIERAIARWPQSSFSLQHAYAFVSYVAIDLYRGDGMTASQRIAREWKALDRSMLLRVELIRIQMLAARATAAVGAAARMRDPSAYLRIAQKDARALRSIATPWAIACADLVDAQSAHLTKRPDAAVSGLRAALVGFVRVEMSLHASVIRRALGTLVGGDEGRALVRSGDEALAAHHVVRPDAFSSIYVPALFSGGSRA